MEIAMLMGVFMIAFLTDWQAIADESVWMHELLLVLCSVNAVIFQREQQNIDWED